MSQLIALVMSLMITSFLYAKECGPQIRDGKNVFTTILECEKDQADCIELKDTKGEFYKVNPSTKMFFKIKSAKFVNDSMLLNLDTISSCWFEAITEKNVGKRLALVGKDIILTMPLIQAKISGGEIQITADLGLCQTIFADCKEEKPKIQSKPAKGSFLDKMMNPPNINRKDINARYGSVMESTYWVTDQSSFMTYEDESLKKLKGIYKVPMTIEKSKKGIPFFYGTQEIDLKKKKFIFTSDAIKLENIGWVKREDIVPYNVINLSTEFEQKKNMVTGLVGKKCAGKMGVSEEEIEKIYRNFEVALCVKIGQPECEDFISKNQSDLEKVPCPNLSN